MMNGQNGFKNPFFDFDFTKALNDFKVPGVDVDALVAAQRKNIEALTQANQLAVEGVQAVARRQIEIARQAIDEFSALVREFSTPSSPEVSLAKQAEFSKVALEKGVANAKELAEMVTKANTEAFNVLNKRVTESFEEVREFATKRR
jgi:phasin family protein